MFKCEARWVETIQEDEPMNKTAFSCPFCHQALKADTVSGEEFSCAACNVMVDILDEDLSMVSVAPHSDVFFMATSEIRIGSSVPAVF
jgi:transcription elongation factor Elf1